MREDMNFVYQRALKRLFICRQIDICGPILITITVPPKLLIRIQHPQET
jgi:hypothetical protein